MSPPPPRGRRPGDDNELDNILRRTRRRRTTGKAKRKRRTTLILAVALIVVLALIASGVGAVAAFRSSCNLDTLRPVEIGQNSFVFAANGSLLGSIPAERNRTPVRLWRVSTWKMLRPMTSLRGIPCPPSSRLRFQATMRKSLSMA